MISAPNPQRLLNGSRLYYLLLITLFFGLSSCGGTKKTAQDDTVMAPGRNPIEAKKKTTRAQELDTIYWTEIDRLAEYEKTIEDLDLDKRPFYNVALLYPFGLVNNNLDDANKAVSNLGRITNYYAGTLMALETLEQEDISLQVSVYDAESGDFNLKLQQCNNADVIIGPKDRGQLASTAQYGKNNEIPVVSPWLSSTKVTSDNPYYVQLNPSLKNHMNKIVEDVKDNYENDQVFLLGRKNRKDRGMMNYIQQVADGDEDLPGQFEELYLEEDSLLLGEYAYQEVFFEDKTTVFILPNWSFVDDENFVYNAVRKLAGEKGLNKVVLYGMPILIESNKITFEHYSNLNMRICRTSYLNRGSVEVNEFRQNYFDKYQDFPSEDVFEGYDMMMFVGRSLKNYGKKFQYFLDTYEASLYQTEFEVLKVFKPGDDDSFDNIQYFQNNHLYILEFKDNYFTSRSDE